MTDHRAKAERLLAGLVTLGQAGAPSSELLPTAIAALTDSQARLADALTHLPAYTVRKDGLGAKWRLAPDRDGGQ